VKYHELNLTRLVQVRLSRRVAWWRRHQDRGALSSAPEQARLVKKKLLISAVALSLLAGGATAASAAPRDVREARQDVREARQDVRQAKQELRSERRAAKRYRAARYVPPRGYQVRRFHRGQSLPAAYRNRAYYVDYRAYGLRAPPRGYEYRRVGNDVVLTAIASGIITAVVLDLFN
jgi:Ni/Co efflux regulator RcnB